MKSSRVHPSKNPCGDVDASANARTPVYRIPADVVVEILGCLSYACRVRASQAFALWRNIALSEPTLWNVIRIERTHPMRRLFELARRAREAPLYIDIARQAADHGTVQQFLDAHAARLVVVQYYCDILAYGGPIGEEILPTPPLPLQVGFPRCEQLADLIVFGRGAELRVDLDNVRLPRLRKLNLSGVTNLEEILPSLTTVEHVNISLDNGPDAVQLKLSTLHGMVGRCSMLRELAVHNISDHSMNFDDLPSVPKTSAHLEAVVLGINGTSHDNTASLVRCFTAKDIVVKRSGLGMAAGMFTMPIMQMWGMPVEDDFGALFQQLEGLVGVTIVPSSVEINTQPPRGHRNGSILLVATDERHFRREVSGIADPRHVLAASGLSFRIQRLDCSVRVWFNRLGVLDADPENLVYNPQPETPVFPELSHLTLLYDDEPNVKRHISMPVCGALQSVVVWELRALPSPRTLDVEAVDEFLASVAGTESVHLDNATFIGPVTGENSSDTVTYRCAGRVNFRTLARVFDTRKFQSQDKIVSIGEMHPFEEDDWL
ncbi:hypothetical protein AURDEDRAFT_149209 [Auricularia subglabra TFB-10046 SS5]|nr:hypothetical protein AURDEDRAFT_149209 [Auricularia subglabra TFB-10046 SS5]